MLKKIRVDQLELGMHLQELCGPWLDHPFWRTKFVLNEPALIQQLRDSAIVECWIDTAKGIDVAPEAVAPPQSPPRAPVTAPAPSTPPAPAPHQKPASRAARPPQPDRNPAEDASPTGWEHESDFAALLCNRAKQTIVEMHEDARLGNALNVEACELLVDEINASLQRNANAMLGLVRLKTHDDYTFMHSVAVCTLMVVLAHRMGQPAPQIRQAGFAGMLHDIGKAHIPIEILNKPGKLTAAEYKLVQQHTRLGHELLLKIGIDDPVVLEVCLHHHERLDGRGYPHGLVADDIGVFARMGAVCDVYDAVTSDRPYKKGWLPAEAIARMAQWAKAGQFDAEVFRAFVKSVGIYPNGSLVRLKSERLAVVVEQGETSLVTPRVRAFYSIRSQLPTPVEMIDLAQAGCTERIVGLESNDQWQFPFLAELSLARPKGRMRPTD